MHVRLEIGVEASGGHVGEHQRARAVVLHFGARLDQRPAQPKVCVEIVTVDITVHEEGTLEGPAVGGVHRPPVDTRTAAGGRREELIGGRIVNGGDAAHAAFDERDRNAPVAHAVDEIQRAVDRVDDPRSVADRPAGFLAKHRVARKRFREPRAAKRFHGTVGDADPVLRVALGFGGIGELAIEIAKRERTRIAREACREFDARIEIDGRQWLV